MIIGIGEKLTSTNLSLIVDKYWNLSHQTKSVTFDFSDTEWVSNAEVIFLVGWINDLVKSKVTVEIQLPKNNGIGNAERKKYFQKKLLLDWNLKDNIDSNVRIHDGGISTHGFIWESINDLIRMPIKEYSVDTFDMSFERLYHDCNLEKFTLNTRRLTSLSHLESELLNYAITKELYSNVIIHSLLAKESSCYYSFSINKKISEIKVNRWNLEQRQKELSKLEKSFFLDSDKFRNIDFVEINFQDFGIGISESLREKYHRDKDLLEVLFAEEMNIHYLTNEDSQILHYALLLFTSKYEVDRRFEVHDFIPRGLYILLELVAKYQGYLEIFSGTGAISISYYKGSKKIHFARKGSAKLIFPGTRIRIVFPSKESMVILKSSEFPKVYNHTINTITTINLLELLSTTKFNFQPDNSLKDIEKRTSLLSLFFESVSKKLLLLKRNSIVILDFAGLNRRTEDILLKLLFFLTHSPVNTSYRLIIVNILAKQLNSVINLSKKVRSSKGLFIYPIPIIYPNLEIDWIGIEDTIIKNELNDIWKQETDYSKFIAIPNLERYASNTIEIVPHENGYNVSVRLPSFLDIVTELQDFFRSFTLNEISQTLIKYRNLQDDKHNYNNILRKKEGYVYLTSHGIIQNEYLSFNNKLYRSEYARLLVTHLVFQNYARKDFQDLSNVTKILSITLSSQFIACEIQNIVKELFAENKAELIALSNYYEFYKEKRFNDIRRGDKVLVINDIISTGRLTETIFDSLERIEADPVACLVLVDSRADDKTYSRFKYPIIALTSFKIERFEKIPPGKKILWINPILNEPVTLKNEKHEINSLMSPEIFLNYVSEDDVVVGNIKSNAFYLTYYLKTDVLIKREFSKRGDSLFCTLFQLLKEKKRKNNAKEISILSRGLNVVMANVDSANKKNKIKTIIKQLNSISDDELFFDYSVDLICYPFLSNIQEIDNDIEAFKDSGLSSITPDVFPIPRVLTEKGWRFTFPPKFLNILTEKLNPSVLILDDGSSTGNTIMQMIDSIAFLNVKSIDVLSIFGRLEDFQKELFSRLKSIRAKKSVIPLNVFFGVHMNLPVLTESENPFTEEAKEIDELLTKLGANIDENFSDYLYKRKKNLLETTNPKDEYFSHPVWENVSKKKMLIFRHKIGKFDSFRLYSEDILNEGSFEFWRKDRISILTLLSVLNLEPNLFKVIKRLIPPDSMQVLVDFCFDLLESESVNDMQLDFLTKSVFYLNTESFLKAKEMLRLSGLFKLKNANVGAYHYFNLQLLLVAFEVRNIEDVVAKKGALSNIFEFINNIKSNDNDLFDRQFRHLNNHLTKLNDSRIGKSDIPINIYRRIQNYFIFALSYEQRHVEKKLEWQLDKLDLKVTDLIHVIEDENNNLELADFKSAREEFSKCYFHTQDEYKYIKSILCNLKDYKPKNLNFNPTLLYESIIEFERLLKEIDTLTKTGLTKLRDSIRLYKESILFTNSSFNEFIRLSQTNLGKVWLECEAKYKADLIYKAINIKTDLNYEVTVNSYVMFLTFDNLIKNKIQYAEESEWDLEAYDIENNRVALRITQFSMFKSGGTGNGQSEIRGFLFQNGVFYKRESINPYYIIRIDIPKQ